MKLYENQTTNFNSIASSCSVWIFNFYLIYNFEFISYFYSFIKELLNSKFFEKRVRNMLSGRTTIPYF